MAGSLAFFFNAPLYQFFGIEFEDVRLLVIYQPYVLFMFISAFIHYEPGLQQYGFALLPFLIVAGNIAQWFPVAYAIDKIFLKSKAFASGRRGRIIKRVVIGLVVLDLIGVGVSYTIYNLY